MGSYSIMTSVMYHVLQELIIRVRKTTAGISYLSLTQLKLSNKAIKYANKSA